MNLREHKLSFSVHAPFAPSALPRRSLASGRSVPASLSIRFRSASLPEVLCPSSGHVVHLSHLASHRHMLCPASQRLEHVQGSFALFAPLHRHLPGLFHPGATPGVLPSEVCSYPEPDTSRLALSCFPLATKTTFRSRVFLLPPCGFAFELFGLSTFLRLFASSDVCPFLRTTVASHGFATVSSRASYSPGSVARSSRIRRSACTRTALSRAGIPGIKLRICAHSQGGFYPLAELAPLLAVPPSRG